MPDESALQSDHVQPVVLVGGASRRFGRDKLRELWHGAPLVTRPINALRAVLGTRVALVGECHPDILPLADTIIPDAFPGAGPIGGIVSALLHARSPILVLAGDMPDVDPDTVRALLDAARSHPDALAVMARTDRLHPTAALYRPGALPSLESRLAQLRRSLHDAFTPDQLCAVPCRADALRNVNTPDDARSP